MCVCFFFNFCLSAVARSKDPKNKNDDPLYMPKFLYAPRDSRPSLDVPQKKGTGVTLVQSNPGLNRTPSPLRACQCGPDQQTGARERKKKI